MHVMLWAILLATILSTGAELRPAGSMIDVGNLPLSMTLSPDARSVVVVLSGQRQMGFQIVDLASGGVRQTVPLRAAFLGAAFSRDGKSLFVSGGEDDVVHAYSWNGTEAAFVRDIDLRLSDKDPKGSHYPAGIATSPDGRFLYVAENVADDLAIIDINTSSVAARVKTDTYPVAVAVAKSGDVFVSAWGGQTVSIIRDQAEVAKVEVGRHPSAIRLSPDETTLYVTLASVDRIAIVDVAGRHVSAVLDDATPAGPHEGTTPNGLAVSPDGKRLFVAEGDNNAVAVFDTKTRRRLGRIPAGWYPSDVIATADRLLVLNSKGRGSRANPGASQPNHKINESYTLSMIDGAISVIDHPLSHLSSMTTAVTRANHWRKVTKKRAYPPFKHVIYVVKENRTFDQVFGDLQGVDADPSLVFFGRDISPNHHALAERFGAFDRFFTSGEVSAQGHVWLTAAYVTDFTEKTVHLVYGHKRELGLGGDADEPAEGYVWDRVAKRGITMRNYGEFADFDKEKNRYSTGSPVLERYTSPTFPGFDLNITDAARADIWMREFEWYATTDTLPALEIVYLPADHTSGARAGKHTPRACMTDNDLALARVVSAVSKTRYWRDTVIFVIEDDAQDGPDHVDSHRSVMLAISAYNRPGTQHRFTNTTDVLATVEEIAGLEPMSQFDYFGRPLNDIFASTPDLKPYEPIQPSVDLHELNPPNTDAAKKSAMLDWSSPDAADEDTLNRILWAAAKGDVPYPEPRHGSTLMWLTGDETSARE
jgi:YVTN family beta-propeller protein